MPVEVSPTVRYLMLFPITGIAALVFALLTLFPSSTDQLFAWTTTSPLTAATLGACFGTAAVLLGLALRERLWANARLAAYPPVVLLGLTLIASLTHRDQLHLEGALLAVIFAWLWLLAHVGLPVLGLMALAVQFAKTGSPPPRADPMPRLARMAVELLAVVLVLVGVLFFVSPGTFAPWWPWPVSTLDLRALAAWSVTFGVAMLLAAWEEDLRRVRIGLAAFLAFGVLALGGLLRYAGEVRWAHPSAWLYLAVVLGAGGIGLLLAGRPYLRFGDRPVMEFD